MNDKRVTTGKTRYRVHKVLFSEPVVVLQIEWRLTGRSYAGMNEDIGKDYEEFEWCDARVEDLIQSGVRLV